MHQVKVTKIPLILCNFWPTWQSTLLNHTHLSASGQKIEQGYLNTFGTSSISKNEFLTEKKRSTCGLRITIETCMLNGPHMCNKELLQTSSQHLNPLSQLQIIRSSTSNSSALFLCTIYLLKFNSKEMTAKMVSGAFCDNSQQ